MENSAAPPAGRTAFDEFVQRHQQRNFIAYAVHYIFITVGWLFKTESLIVAAFVRSLGASNFFLGLFPMIAQVGVTVPQLLMANRVEHLPHKKTAMAWSFFLYPLTWLLAGVAVFIVPSGVPGLLLAVFLALYCVFSLNLGCFQVLSSIIAGKVVPARTRGRLIMVSGVAGGCGAIVCTFLFVRPILKTTVWDPLGPYGVLFIISGLLFLVSWAAIFFIKEPPLAGTAGRRDLLTFTRASFRLVRHDRNFQVLFLAGCLFAAGGCVIQFYTSYAKARLNVTGTLFAWFLVCQVGATMLGSLIYGRMADRRGNRAVLRLTAVLVALNPVLALTIGLYPGLPHREWFFCAVYVLIGAGVPISQIIINYILEIAPLELHPNYLGVYHALRCVTLLAPPLVGFLMDTFYYHKVFLGLAVVLVLTIVLTFKLIEPRHLEDKDEYKKEIALG